MISLQKVAKFFGSKVVLKNISCTLTAGSITLLTGNNGAGKSTLLRLIAGLSQPSAGRLSFSEEVLIGYVGHATFLYPHLTALENLRFWARVYGVDASDAALMRLLERVGLAAHAHERAGIFSRGMAQRLNLARVLMRTVDVLLLDEPCTGLDQESQELVRREMCVARQRGACVLVVTHDYAGDSTVADRVISLGDGKIVYDGPPEHAVTVAGSTECSNKAVPEVCPAALTPPVQEETAAVREPGLLAFALALARKDLLLSLVRGNGLIQALLLGLLLIFMFSLAQGVGEKLSPQNAAAVFWLSSAFCQVLIFNQLYAIEEQCTARIGLLLSPAPRQGIWLGKFIAGFCLLFLAQLLFFPATIVFLGQQLAPAWDAALLMVLLADIGVCALGALLGALAQGGAVRESLLSVVLFPLLIPLLLAGITVGAVGLGAFSADGPQHWLQLTLAFDAVFISAALFLFGFLYTGDEA